MTVQGIDYGKLSLCDALDLAILIEEEAHERYEELAHQMEIHHTAGAAAFFHEMARNEAKHGADLQQRRSRLFGDAPRVVKRSMLWDVEAPEYDDARAFMSPRDAMNVALACEQKAHDFFVGALPHLKDADVKALFLELRDEEVVHQSLVNAELAKLPPDDESGFDDLVDEPTGQ